MARNFEGDPIAKRDTALQKPARLRVSNAFVRSMNAAYRERRSEFYFRLVKTIFYERAQRVSKILFLTLENKIHIFKPPCNFLFSI